MEIIRGTTPTLIFTFSEIEATDINQCYMMIKQRGQTIVEKTFADSVILEDGGLSFTLAQADTLSLCANESAKVMLDWKTTGGVRGRSNIYDCAVKVAGKENEY